MTIISLFSSREISIFIWTLIIILFMTIKNPEIKNSIFQLFKSICNLKLGVFFFITNTYVTLSIVFLSKLSIWKWIYLKEIILWFLFIGLPICITSVADRNEKFFYNLLKNNFKVAVFIEFFVKTFTFNFFVELFLIVPISTFVFGLYTVNKSLSSHKLVNLCFSFILNILGLVILIFAGMKAIENYTELNLLELLIIFSIPITMSIIFLPLAYCFALYSEFELLFLRLKFILTNNLNCKVIALKILLTSKFSLTKLEYLKKYFFAKLYPSITEEEINNIIKGFKNPYKNE